MNMKAIASVVGCGFVLSLASLPVWAEDTLMQEANELFAPIPKEAPEIKNNPATEVKVELGKMLYFEPRLSRSALISCNTCHNVGLGGADYQETSTGHGWKKGPRNAPTVLNSVFNVAQFWDGRAKDLAEQAKGPVQAGVEMNNTPENVVKNLKSMPLYVDMFKQAFPGEADPVTFDNMAKAIEVFEATLITPNAPFDKYLKGDTTALNKDEKVGLSLFVEHGCVSCHGGVNMGGDDYYQLGVVEMPREEILAGDKGRFSVTHAEGDEFMFKSPSLRNIELTPPYFHSGVVWDLTEAVTVMNNSQLGADLSDEEIHKIVDFLKSTTGEQPKVEHPILPAPTKDTLHPEL
ncbi:cytochrome-c peroxidase [Desulfogranum japonicum]|uniref:cytochrome-c peroxidase n=1 Tax=Desulfogranum japonicum TaxID=231447 RepID=UPI00041B9839|nr:cytochrome-c peroxidase [Desulfogranum japonicum]